MTELSDYKRIVEKPKLAALADEISRLRRVAGIAERLCAKMEHPTASVTIIDQTELRAALDALSQ